ncbi:MAG: restriction endonuclease subunit M, partial [Gammaproteobacteria bacterium]|nr:restriction endonuclease subunit M [Gammaproteobacteria bacterium]
EKVGSDWLPNTPYKRTPDGEEIFHEAEDQEHTRINGDRVKQVFKRQDKIVDNDLPLTAEAYRKFKQEHKNEFPFQDELP